MKASYAIVCAVMPFVIAVSPARGTLINFDTDAAGQPLTAPSTFDNASPLRNLYAPLGVHFAGPSPELGGAILNDSSFTINALSGHNFLAFTGTLGPETISFDTPMSLVTVYASGVSHNLTFTMQAFNSGGTLLDSMTLSTTAYSQLSVASSGDIASVVVSCPNAGVNAYVLDDLSASSVPAPSSLLFMSGGGAIVWRRRRHVRR